jgi:hypothetical protein
MIAGVGVLVVFSPPGLAVAVLAVKIRENEGGELKAGEMIKDIAASSINAKKVFLITTPIWLTSKQN